MRIENEKLQSCPFAPKKLLVVAQFFWPEPIGTAFYATDLARWFSSQETDVTVLTGRPYYPEFCLMPVTWAQPVIPGFTRWRRLSLDELPQLLNVLRGDKSLVGPLPHVIEHNEEYSAIIAGYFARHRVKPGITGWAQVNGLRGETDAPDKMEARIDYDVHYIENWSLWRDLRILAKTALVGFVSKNAY